eukprot:GFKZ01010163.1.p1 GENE.GFKZ01010163.1~~GFKZ01010163.1.p1  ORF type:complete len:480 (+),score=77.21 GFKZ01010163.1:192-1631(+)
MAPKITAKPPKGTRDIAPHAMAVRERAFSLITQVFRAHGAVAIDTPVFELRDVLQNKYGEDSKLIYHLSDDMSSETGEKLSLRYDLSVPFARYLASNNVSQIKRYHIGKVYRRDRPAMERGRFREFYQCDFDIAGAYPAMIPDAEVLVVMMQMFDTLAAQSESHQRLIGSYEIKISHRVILDAVLTVCGVPEDKLRTICSAVDKLDKMHWRDVRKEMVVEKGLQEEVADRIERFVSMRGTGPEVLHMLRQERELVDMCVDALNEMEKLFRLVACMREGMKNRLVFDMSLARGLDYYTGVIFEAVLVDKTVNLGSIGAGGRYDGLVGMFRRSGVPCVGCSLGIERIMNLMVKAAEEQGGGKIRATATDVLVATIGKGTMEERLRLCAELWRRGVAAEFCFNENWNVGKQVQQAVSGGVPLVAVVGEDELRDGVVKLKVLATKEERVVDRGGIAAAIDEELTKANESGNGTAGGQATVVDV